MFMINSQVENSLPEWSMERVQTKQSLMGLRNLNKIVNSYHINTLHAFMGSRYLRLSDNFLYDVKSI